MSKTLKSLIIILVILIALAAVYFLFFYGKEVAPTAPALKTDTGNQVSGLATAAGNDTNADQIGQEFLSQLLNIRSIKLREDVFSRPAFVSLEDFTINLVQPGNEGRQNPFAPFGIDATATTTTQSGSVIQGASGGTSADPFFGPATVVPLGGSTTTTTTTTSGPTTPTPAPNPNDLLNS